MRNLSGLAPILYQGPHTPTIVQKRDLDADQALCEDWGISILHSRLDRISEILSTESSAHSVQLSELQEQVTGGFQALSSDLHHLTLMVDGLSDLRERDRDKRDTNSIIGIVLAIEMRSDADKAIEDFPPALAPE
jgi:citrate synthase